MNTKTEHTPGPWVAYGFDVDTAENAPVAECYGYQSDGEIEANARLIAAAPDLLAALEVAERWMTEKGVSHEYPVLQNARAAIAKAKGGDQ